VDRILDALIDRGLKPLLELGFMPEALSTRPQPYRHTWPDGEPATGWACAPTDYRRGGELVYALASHAAQRYGRSRAESWLWECWNEPDGGFWRGTLEEYLQLYDFSAHAVKSVLPRAVFGGPHSTGPENAKSIAFLRGFLEHCRSGTNYATGARGAPLDYIGFHTKGRATVVDGRIRMNLKRQVSRAERGFGIVSEFPELRHLPVILGESDPDGTAAVGAAREPGHEHRNTAIYPATLAAAWSQLNAAAALRQVKLAGIVTWAFQFEDQPYFAGLRSLSTNGIDKPVLNWFRMMGRLPPDAVACSSDGAVPLSEVLESGVSGKADVGAAASRSRRQCPVLLWHYHDDAAPAPPAHVEVALSGLPAPSVMAKEYLIDRTHSHAYTAWRTMGSPPRPDAAQYKQLAARGQRQRAAPPSGHTVSEGSLRIPVQLPRHSVSLLRLRWRPMKDPMNRRQFLSTSTAALLAAHLQLLAAPHGRRRRSHRDQPFRHPRVHAPLPPHRRRALPGGHRRLRHSARIPRLGALLQRTARHCLPRHRAARPRQRL
jgi:xylan 1,4-beta-xylosidase